MAGMTGHVAEYTGEAIRALSMEGRMTVCNMSIEGGARAGLIAADDTTFAYLEGRPGVPEDWEAAVERWRGTAATRTRSSTARSSSTSPRWRRRSPGARTRARPCPSRRTVPEPATPDEERALAYMGLEPGTAAAGRRDRPGVHRLVHQRPHRRPARRRRASWRASAWPTGVRAMVVPGSMAGEGAGRGRGPRPGLQRRRLRVAQRGLLHVPRHEPRHPGSPASAARPPRTATSRAARAAAGAPTSCRPEMAAAAAVAGHLVDVRSWS